MFRIFVSTNMENMFFLVFFSQMMKGEKVLGYWNTAKWKYSCSRLANRFGLYGWGFWQPLLSCWKKIWAFFLSYTQLGGDSWDLQVNNDNNQQLLFSQSGLAFILTSGVDLFLKSEIPSNRFRLICRVCVFWRTAKCAHSMRELLWYS